MKKAVSLLLILVSMVCSLLALSGCLPISLYASFGGSGIKPLQRDTDDNYQDIQTAKTPKLFDSIVIYDDNDIRALLTKVDGTNVFEYEVENSGNKDISFAITGVSVNGCTVYDLVFPTTITPGNKAEEKYSLSGAEDYGIKEVESLEIYFTVTEADGFAEIDSGSYLLDISEDNDDYIFDYEFEAELFYEDEDVEAYLVRRGDEFSDFDVIYKNKTNMMISAALTDVSVNGVMITATTTQGMFPYTILPNSYGYTGASDGSFTVWSALGKEISEKGLNNVETIAGKLEFSNFKLSYYMITDNIEVFCK